MEVYPDVDVELSIEFPNKNYLVCLALDKTVKANAFKYYGSGSKHLRFSFNKVQRISYLNYKEDSDHVIGLCLWVYLEHRKGIPQPLEFRNILLVKGEISNIIVLRASENHDWTDGGLNGKISFTIKTKSELVGKLRVIDDDMKNTEIMAKKRTYLSHRNKKMIGLLESPDLDRNSSMYSHFIFPEHIFKQFDANIFLDAEKHVKRMMFEHGVAFDPEIHWLEVLNFVGWTCFNYADDLPPRGDQFYPPYFSNVGDCEDFTFVLIHFHKFYINSVLDTECCKAARKYQLGLLLGEATVLTVDGMKDIPHVFGGVVLKSTFGKDSPPKIELAETTEMTMYHLKKMKMAKTLEDTVGYYARHLISNPKNSSPFFYKVIQQIYMDDYSANFINGNGTQGVTYDELVTGKFTLDSMDVMDPEYKELAEYDSRFKLYPECCYESVIKTGKIWLNQKENPLLKGIGLNDIDGLETRFIGYYSPEDLLFPAIQDKIGRLKEDKTVAIRLERKTIGKIYAFYQLTVFNK